MTCERQYWTLNSHICVVSNYINDIYSRKKYCCTSYNNSLLLLSLETGLCLLRLQKQLPENIARAIYDN